jgi:hypothetical protein
VISSRYDGASNATSVRFSCSRSAGGSEAAALTVAKRSTTSLPESRSERVKDSSTSGSNGASENASSGSAISARAAARPELT